MRVLVWVAVARAVGGHDGLWCCSPVVGVCRVCGLVVVVVATWHKRGHAVVGWAPRHAGDSGHGGCS